jgi:ABC-type lipoprotein export system ATPase subunit
MINMQSVSKTFYQEAAPAVTPVQAVNLQVKNGEFVLLTGRSGSGKTTLLNLAAGLIKPTSGKVLIDDANIWDLTDRQLSALRLQKTGFVFQFPSLIPSLSVMENTILPYSFGMKDERHLIQKRAVDLLEKLGLAERTRAFPGQLSAGEQKRAVLARALMNKPEILFADEPTSDLDELTEREIMSVLRDLHAGGTTILMVTHNTELIPFANRIIRIEGGNLVEPHPWYQIQKI